MDILDFHLRLTPAPQALDALLDCLDQTKIRRGVLCAGGVVDRERISRQLRSGEFSTVDADNDAVADAVHQNPGRLRACWFGNPHGGLDRYAADGAGFVGLELSPAVHGVPLPDRRNEAFVEAAATHGHWIYVVCINREGCDVDSLIALAGRYPNVTFVVGHLGYGNIDYDGMRLISTADNVLVESSGGYASVLSYAVGRLGADRVLFGSEYPLQHPAVELTKVRCAGLSEAAVTAVLHGNAERLMNGAW